MINVLFSALPARWPDYAEPLRAAFAAHGIDANLSCDHPPEEVDYIVFAPNGPITDFTPFTRCKAVLGLWAGVETVVDNETLTQPLARMVDSGLRDGMVQWVAGHVLRHHLGLDIDILGQDGTWTVRTPPLARDRRVGILGLGALGTACGQALAGLDFPVMGWSRRPKKIENITCYSGEAGLRKTLENSDILVLLLPQTPETENTLNADTLALMPRGAVVINPGRGPLIDDDALLEALESGQIGHATLDVFRIEPLPEDHPFWAHPNVTVTPHIASATRPETASTLIAENIQRVENGQSLLNQVDRAAGY
ncbi:2-hydroxyacid dehydrogenase [Oceaniglobus ichthyenteri]|uniref:2-hydroxyacid dehydrogenase n=1 Tax=Oceaniglobus ichthyenteri TaxID=2136177 RepID=UPI000D380ECB|nr:glyoxylate/hydroxypyruvate reductase A [Oceaniglobus ichthyenteri]